MQVSSVGNGIEWSNFLFPVDSWWKSKNITCEHSYHFKIWQFPNFLATLSSSASLYPSSVFLLSSWIRSTVGVNAYSALAPTGYCLVVLRCLCTPRVVSCYLPPLQAIVQFVTVGCAQSLPIAQLYFWLKLSSSLYPLSHRVFFFFC